MKKLVLSLISLSVCVFCLSQVPPALQPAYDAAVQAMAAAPKIDEKVWQGFRFKEYPVLIYDAATRTALAVNVNHPPAEGFSATSNPMIFQGSIPAGDTLGNGIRPFGQKLMAWVEVKELSKTSPPSFVVIEEAFKIFEAYRGFNDRGVFSPGAYPVLNAENNALARLENEILLKALTSPKEQARGYLSAFSAAKEKRQALLPKEIADSEESRELIDGAAAYAAYLSLTTEQQGAYLQEVVIKLGAFNKGGESADKRFRETGFAQCYLFGLLQYDFKSTVDKYSKDSLKPALKAVIANIQPADISFFSLETARAEEAAATKAEEDKKAAVLNNIQKASGLVILVKLENFLAQSNGKLKWSEKVDPASVTYFGKDKVFGKLYKLTGGDYFKFFAFRPVLFSNKTLTMGLGVEEFQMDNYFITLDGAAPTFEKDAPPVTGLFESRGPNWDIKILKAVVQWDYTTRTLTIEPVYDEATALAPPPPPPPPPPAPAAPAT